MPSTPSTGSSGPSRRSSAAQDGPFPFVPPASEVRAKFERQAALASGIVPTPPATTPVPNQTANVSARFSFETNDDSGFHVPDYPMPAQVSDTNRHGVYDSPNDPGMSPSNCCLVREPSQFREASISCTSPSNSPTPRTESKEKKSGNDGKSKFLSLFEKLPSRPKNAETILAAESSGNYNFEGGNGRNLPAGDTRFTSMNGTRASEATPTTPPNRRGSYSPSIRRVSRPSMLATMRSRIAAFFTTKPINRGRTWKPSNRTSSNPFSPFARRPVMHDITGSGDGSTIQPVMTGNHVL